jgi:hypothetical protein
MSTAPAIPAWQAQQLQALASQGDLSGVDPAILAAIDQAESSGQGGAINSSGYGGYFGLGAGSSYPAGSPTAALLQGTGPAAFDTQAELAASEYASLLEATGGNTYAAEAAYQTGLGSGISSTEGTNVFASLGVPLTASGAAPASGTTNAVLTSSSGGPVGAVINSAVPGLSVGTSLLNDITGGAAGGVVASAEKGAFSILVTIAFVAAALGLILLGLTRLFPGVTRTITTTIPAVAA